MSAKKLKTSGKLFTCDKCGAVFEDKWCFESHMDMHVEEEKMCKCEHCGALFLAKFLLRKHSLIHTGEKPFKCADCCAPFKTVDELKEHMGKDNCDKPHTGATPFKCSECFVSFSHYQTLMQHMRKHTGEKPFMCEDCGETFAYECSLEYHAQRRHERGVVDRTQDVMAHELKRSKFWEKHFKCSECGWVCDSTQKLKKHERAHRAQKRKKPHKCAVCGDAFVGKECYEAHMRLHSSDDTMHRCPHCSSEFAKLESLQHHVQFHNPDRMHDCPICEAKISQYPIFLKHVKSHSITNQVDEDINYTTSSRNRKWRDASLIIGRFKCSECEAPFSNKRLLKDHMPIHW